MKDKKISGTAGPVIRATGNKMTRVEKKMISNGMVGSEKSS